MGKSKKVGKKKNQKVKDLKNQKTDEFEKKYSKLYGQDPSRIMVSVDATRRRIKQKVNLRRFVRWPKYIRTQRRKRILRKRMKIPPTLNQFNFVAAKPFAHDIVQFLRKYKPESKSSKKIRLEKSAEKELSKEKKKEEEEEVDEKLSNFLIYGINEVVSAIEKKHAKLVVIAHDVDPIEFVLFLPALCHRLEIPYVIVKSKARLGGLVGKKNTTCLCLTNVEKKDRKEFEKLANNSKNHFNDKYEERMRVWGGNKLSKQAQMKVDRTNALLAEKNAELKRKF